MRSLFLLLEARLLFPCTEMEFFHFYISYFWRRICVCFGFFFSLLLLYFASLVPCHVIHFPLVNFAPVYIRLRSGFMCRFDDFNHLMSFWAVRQCLCVCECMYIHFTNLTIIITKEKLLTAKYTEFYTLTALHNVCHAFFFHHHVFIRHWLSASASCSHLLSYTSFSRFCFGISLCLRLCTAIRSFPMQSYRKYFSIIMFCCCFFAWQTPNAKSMFWTD